MTSKMDGQLRGGKNHPKMNPTAQNNSLGQMEQTNHLLMTPMYRKVTVALLL